MTKQNEQNNPTTEDRAFRTTKEFRYARNVMLIVDKAKRDMNRTEQNTAQNSWMREGLQNRMITWEVFEEFGDHASNPWLTVLD